MKELLAVAALILVAVVWYKVREDGARRAAAEAAAAKAAEVQAVQKNPAQSLAQVLDPYLTQLFSKPDRKWPADLVPPLEIMKRRVLARRPQAAPAQQKFYDAGLRTIEQMIAVAEERTRTLEAVLRIAARPGSPLDGAGSAKTSNAFFSESAMRRWDDTRNQRKAGLDQLFAQLRRAEEDARKAAGEGAAVEDFALPRLPPVYVRLDADAPHGTALERGATGPGRAFPWRKSYYEQYGAAGAGAR